MAIRQLGDVPDLPADSPVSQIRAAFKGSAKDWSLVYSRATIRLWYGDSYQGLLKCYLEAEVALWNNEQEIAASKPVAEEWR